MSNKVENESQLALSLSQKLMDGTATEEEKGTALKLLQTSLSVTMATGVSSLYNQINSLNGTMERLFTRMEAALQDQIELMSAEDCYDFIQKIQSKQIQVLDLYRKIVQGKELFATSALTEEEKMVIKLMKSFKSVDEKNKFFSLVSDLLEPKVETFEDEQ